MILRSIILTRKHEPHDRHYVTKTRSNDLLFRTENMILWSIISGGIRASGQSFRQQKHMIQWSIILSRKHEPHYTWTQTKTWSNDQSFRNENMIQWSIISYRKHDPMINHFDVETWSTDQCFTAKTWSTDQSFRTITWSNDQRFVVRTSIIV